MTSRWRVILDAHWRSAGHTWREDPQVRFGWLGKLVTLGLLGTVIANRLAESLVPGLPPGAPALAARLGFLLLGVWGLTAALAVIGTFQRGLGGDEPLLLSGLPIPPADRFRALYALVLARDGDLLAFLAGAVGAALVKGVGGAAAAGWLGALVSGMAAVAGAAVVLTLWLVRTVLLRPGRLLAAAFGIASTAAALAVAARDGWLAMPGELALRGPGSIPPGWVGAGFLVVWTTLLGPLAHPAGRLYMSAFHALQSRSGRGAGFRIPGGVKVAQYLARLPGPVGALFFKAWLVQSRNPFFWLRALFVASGAGIFPLVEERLSAFGAGGAVTLVGYTLLLVQLGLAEQEANAIAGEGDRLALYITAPLRLASYMWARFWVFALPACGGGLVLATWLNLWLHLAAGTLAVSVLTALVSAAGSTSLLVWGSAWDEDLEARVEGPIQLLLQEEAPVAPRRLLLFSLSLLLQAAAVALVWRLPPLGALGATTLLAAAASALAWRLGLRHLQALVRGG